MTTGPHPWRAALRNSAKLTAVLVSAWLLLAAPAWWISGPRGLEAMTLAAVLCLIPGWLVFAVHSQYGTAAPLAVVLMGTAGRMIAVLVGAIVVKSARPDFGTTSFALWLGVFYIVSLATETKLLLTPPVRGTSTDE